MDMKGTSKSKKLSEQAYNKGDMIVVDLGYDSIGDEKNGRRPCVVLSNSVMGHRSNNIIIAPMTNANNKKDSSNYINLLPTHVFMSSKYYRSLDTDSILQLEDIRSISKRRIVKYIGYVSVKTQLDINKKLQNMLINKGWYGNMAKNKSQDTIKKELYNWYKKTMAEHDLSWEEATTVLVDEYRESDVNAEKEIYSLLIDIDEEPLKSIRLELDDDYDGEPMV